MVEYSWGNSDPASNVTPASSPSPPSIRARESYRVLEQEYEITVCIRGKSSIRASSIRGRKSSIRVQSKSIRRRKSRKYSSSIRARESISKSNNNKLVKQRMECVYFGTPDSTLYGAPYWTCTYIRMYNTYTPSPYLASCHLLPHCQDSCVCRGKTISFLSPHTASSGDPGVGILYGLHALLFQQALWDSSICHASQSHM